MNLTIHLTDNCNMNCSYCIRDKHPCDMTEETLIKACDLAFSKGKRAGLCFFGGEPLLKKDLIYKALEYCRAKSVETGMRFDCKMTTNGTLLDAGFLAVAREHGMVIGLSFDGLAQDVARRYVTGGRTFELLERKAKLLLEYLPDSIAMATICPDAVPYYSDSVKYFYELGFKKVSMTPAYGHKVSWSEEKLEELRAELEKTAKFLGEIYLKGAEFDIGPLDVKIRQMIRGYNPDSKCHLGARQMPVTPKGDLYPCTSFIGDKEYYLGNVYDGIDEDNLVRISSKSNTPEECLSCDLNKRCTNSCGCANRMNTGDENRVSPLQCAYERMVIEVSDKLGDYIYNKDPELFMSKYS